MGAAVTTNELSRPVEAPPRSLLAELADRSGCSLLEARRVVRCIRSGKVGGICPRTRAFVEAVYKLGPLERAALCVSVAPFVDDGPAALERVSST